MSRVHQSGISVFFSFIDLLLNCVVEFPHNMFGGMLIFVYSKSWWLWITIIVTMLMTTIVTMLLKLPWLLK